MVNSSRFLLGLVATSSFSLVTLASFIGADNHLVGYNLLKRDPLPSPQSPNLQPPSPQPPNPQPPPPQPNEKCPDTPDKCSDNGCKGKTGKCTEVNSGLVMTDGRRTPKLKHSQGPHSGCDCQQEEECPSGDDIPLCSDSNCGGASNASYVSGCKGVSRDI